MKLRTSRIVHCPRLEDDDPKDSIVSVDSWCVSECEFFVTKDVHTITCKYRDMYPEVKE